ncbi:hypothetical protein TELCIR_18019 [Teladorsagia circumcincta]|uniref:Uncharacterized protein n=1 Tax=Teladorsagia circumcincta TaxID=45464 RepID=A0A2G9TR43_TELCI|nr:hypothetical protein TELCIR_18019 [Teladorsagia circumcincta]
MEWEREWDPLRRRCMVLGCYEPFIGNESATSWAVEVLDAVSEVGDLSSTKYSKRAHLYKNIRIEW